MTTRADDPVAPVSGGLTKREHIAALVLAGSAASHAGDAMTARDAADMAVIWADALIDALNEEPGR